MSLRSVGTIAGVTVGAIGVGTTAELLTGPKLVKIDRRRQPTFDWIAEATRAFEGANSDGTITPEEMHEAAAYIRDHHMPDTVDANVSSHYVSFSEAYTKDVRQAGNTALGPIVGYLAGGLGIIAGGIVALTSSGPTRAAGLGVLGAGAGLMGGFMGSAALGNRRLI